MIGGFLGGPMDRRHSLLSKSRKLWPLALVHRPVIVIVIVIIIVTIFFTRDGDDHCHGELSDFSTLLSPAARAATVFTGFAIFNNDE